MPRFIPEDAAYSDHPDVVALAEAALDLESHPAGLTRPGVAPALVAVLREIAWMGAHDADQLCRIGCPEIIALARAILGEDD